MSDDISKHTLLVLVALTIIVSLLGTWTVYTEATKVRTSSEPTPISQTTSTSGKISLEIAPPAQAPVTTGRVVLTIV
jgi:hypothetical protein